MMRSATNSRETTETRIRVDIDLDGSGNCTSETGVGFLDHMLEQLARHALFDLSVKAEGDRHIDDHHTVEDVGIVIGQALSAALGDKRGIRRFGSCSLSMDDAWVDVALDLSGRPFLGWKIELPTAKIGSFDTELVREFFQAFTTHGGITLHAELRSGLNSHHIAEATFKAAARSLRMAAEVDERSKGLIPSTKELL